MEKATKETSHQKDSLLAKTKKNTPDNTLFPIVGIGSSAGGLEALEQFLRNMPANNGMAFVVIQHLDPSSKCIMRELLQRVTKMRVAMATDRVKVNPNCVYIIPPNKSMSILNNKLHLFEPIETRGLRLPVDFFFRSLADDRHEHSIGIILSGMGSDGSAGVKAIKEKSGIVLVQEPSSAKFDSMPRCALEAVPADIVASASELPAKLLAIIKNPVHLSEKQKLGKDTSALEKIIILLRNKTGNNFYHYKKNTVYRRIERRMNIHQISKISSYVRYLQENQIEVNILFKELLIGVTSFFRDIAVWKKMKDDVIPSLIAKLPPGYPLRAWIPGCSSGEEAYSLAIVFKEVMEETKSDKYLSLQIFATDLSLEAIDNARKGFYTANIVTDVSPSRLSRFFVKTDNGYRIGAEIREMVVFSTQNVIKDPPFTKLDILSCRNLLIYLDSELQDKLLALFHYSLNSDGILLLGNSETDGNKGDLFSIIDSKLKIYRRSHSLAGRNLFDFPTRFTEVKSILSENQMPVKATLDNLQSLTDQLLLQQFSPASVLVNNQGDILYITGNTGKYLAPAAGKANMNIFAMARDGLREQLPSAFRRAAQNHEKIILRNVKVGANGRALFVNLTIQQIESPQALKGNIIVIFADTLVEQKYSEPKKGKTYNIAAQNVLESEVLRIKEELQITREEMQTSQEELTSTNEELQSANEELQSTNEELTTSKEEMQSLNEELHTVNAELQAKISDYTKINNDMSNLLNSTEIAALFLSKDLKIRQFTVQATKIFRLIPSDIGRVFTDQVCDLDYPNMYADTKEVLRTLVFVEKIAATSDGRWFSIRIMPYRTSDDKIEGLVITFTDVTKSKRLEEELNETISILRKHNLLDRE